MLGRVAEADRQPVAHPEPLSGEEMGQLGGPGVELVPGDGALVAVLADEDHGDGVTAFGRHLAQAGPVGDADFLRFRAQAHPLIPPRPVAAPLTPTLTRTGGW